jgi:hypothetical protein
MTTNDDNTRATQPPAVEAAYQEGDLEKFFGVDPDFTGAESTSDYIDRIRGGSESTPTVSALAEAQQLLKTYKDMRFSGTRSLQTIETEFVNAIATALTEREVRVRGETENSNKS